MRPSDDEIKKVGSALVTIGVTSFTPDEKRHLTQFLHSCAIDFNENKVKNVFQNDNAEIIIDAMKTLNTFANDYQDHEIIHQFHDEIVDLLINVNDMNGAMVI